jgi:hypothetical protein
MKAHVWKLSDGQHLMGKTIDHVQIWLDPDLVIRINVQAQAGLPDSCADRIIYIHSTPACSWPM